MLKSHVKFHSVEGKRLILIADDEPANRALLGLVTEDEYDILYAEDGEEALKIVCSAEEKTEIVPLSEQTDIVVINREYIETLLQNLQN